MEKLEKMIVENGITYVLGEDDIYYPDLQLPEGTNYNIGKFGHKIGRASCRERV